MASVSVVFPWSTWAIMAILRISIKKSRSPLFCEIPYTVPENLLGVKKKGTKRKNRRVPWHEQYSLRVELAPVGAGIPPRERELDKESKDYGLIVPPFVLGLPQCGQGPGPSSKCMSPYSPRTALRPFAVP